MPIKRLLCPARVRRVLGYERPLYQVVGLSPPGHLSERHRGELRSIQALLAQALGKTP